MGGGVMGCGRGENFCAPKHRCPGLGMRRTVQGCSWVEGSLEEGGAGDEEKRAGQKNL